METPDPDSIVLLGFTVQLFGTAVYMLLQHDVLSINTTDSMLEFIALLNDSASGAMIHRNGKSGTKYKIRTRYSTKSQYKMCSLFY
jgi:hypothetical protein